MQYQNIIKFLDNTQHQPSKCRKKAWNKTNDDPHGTYDEGKQTEFKNLILQSSIYDYSEAYMLVSGTITVTALAVGGSNNSIQLVFKNYAQFNYCMI